MDMIYLFYPFAYNIYLFDQSPTVLMYFDQINYAESEQLL